MPLSWFTIKGDSTAQCIGRQTQLARMVSGTSTESSLDSQSQAQVRAQAHARETLASRAFSTAIDKARHLECEEEAAIMIQSAYRRHLAKQFTSKIGRHQFVLTVDKGNVLFTVSKECTRSAWLYALHRAIEIAQTLEPSRDSAASAGGKAGRRGAAPPLARGPAPPNVVKEGELNKYGRKGPGSSWAQSR